MTNTNGKVKVLVQTALLSAIVVLMAFTPLGYLRLKVIAISFLMVPVGVGAIALGPKVGAFLGFVFGITSFLQCFGMDAFGTFLCSLQPFFCFCVCVVSRTLAGFLVGVLARTLWRNPSPLHFALCGLSAACLNTILFVGSLVLLFWNNNLFVSKMAEWQMNVKNVMVFVVAFAGTNCIAEAVACSLITLAIAVGLQKSGLMPARAAQAA